ncbi:hypothetical protein CR513_12530, partial [Mucuna pruriens]
MNVESLIVSSFIECPSYKKKNKKDENKSLKSKAKRAYIAWDDNDEMNMRRVRKLTYDALHINTNTNLLGFKLRIHHLALVTLEVLVAPKKYQHLVGHLIHLCFTRSELSYNVHFKQQPKQEHWEDTYCLTNKTKYIEIDYHFICDKILKNHICPTYVPTTT